MRRTEIVVVEEAAWAGTAAGRIDRLVARRLEDAGRCTLALAGGSTPRPVYERLRERRLHSRKGLVLFFGDERCVPPGDPASNYGMVREALFGGAEPPPARLRRMRGEMDDPDEAARAYERDLPRPLDVLLLGIGEDGHTASLFPGSPALRETARRVVAAEGPVEPRRRLTVTPPVIKAAREVVVLARGAGKREAVARALEGPADLLELPAVLARQAVWILDPPAAAGLEEVR